METSKSKVSKVMEDNSRQSSDAEERKGDLICEKTERERVHDDISAMFEKVPMIGSAWRWYDFPYKLIHWMSSSWRRKIFTKKMLSRLNRALNYFTPFNDYDRYKVAPQDSQSHNLIVPENEHVSIGGLWVIELFPPGYVHRLENSLKNNGWDSSEKYYAGNPGNIEHMQSARQSSGSEWWKLGTVISPNSGIFSPNSKEEKLPEPFAMVEVKAIQIGSGLTAVVAFFRLSDDRIRSLDKVWHAEHEPRLIQRKRHRPRAEDRRFAALRTTQEAREKLHLSAKQWLVGSCPGAFASNLLSHPVIDLCLFDKHNPLTDETVQEMREPLRALGVDGNYFSNLVSENLPNLTFVHNEGDSFLDSPLSECWSLAGNRSSVLEGFSEQLRIYSNSYDDSTVANVVDDAVEDFLLIQSMFSYLEIMQKKYSRLRDAALKAHGKFKLSEIKHLRKELLSNGIDITTVAKDSLQIWSPSWRKWNGISLAWVDNPDTISKKLKNHEAVSEPEDAIQIMSEAQKTAFDQLIIDYEQYRDVLSTVSSLGMNLSSMRLARRALVVSLVSLLLALVMVLFSEFSDTSLLATLMDFVKSI
jgi:hypothetical protein